MMTVLKMTRIWLERITKIELENEGEKQVFDVNRRMLTIWTADGEKYELILEAATAEQLEFKKPEQDEWLTPKVYQGKGEET
jgi:hypothetical protein